MKKSADVIYLTRKQWDAFKEEEHRERVALSRRVARGELTPEEANREASIFAYVPSVAEVPLNFDQILRNARSIRLSHKKMVAENRRQFALEELTPVFKAQQDLGHPCILMGGQAVCHWAKRFLPSEPALQDLECVAALLSKDVDFQGERAAAVAFARALGQRAELPSFRDAFGNLMSGKFSVPIAHSALSVEVLRKVPGLTSRLTSQLATFEQAGAVTLRVLNPLGVVMAKSWNAVNITKEGRHDVEQLFVAVVCLRAFYRTLFIHAESNPGALRPALKLVETGLRFTEFPAGRKTAEGCGLDWTQILPHNYVGASTRQELIRLRERRVPDWLAHIADYKRAMPANDTRRRMLEILARYAEPLCAQAAVRRASRRRP